MVSLSFYTGLCYGNVFEGKVHCIRFSFFCFRNQEIGVTKIVVDIIEICDT
jgi:hypothetical protein